MARSFTDVCPACGTVYTARTIIGAQNQAERCAERCTPDPNPPTLDEALDNARKELGDWN